MPHVYGHPPTSDVVTAPDGRQFIRQPDGSLVPLPQRPEPNIVTMDGRQFIRHPDGSLRPLPPTFAGREPTFGRPSPTDCLLYTSPSPRD